ncbi:MAG: pro-sigmaK processing inhibitor BofA family protein [Lachnospiraceae bacterium]|nr:pro-sigmaK processing inhibitor BofA family protein [Lachnospiraceae bacterium]
MLKWDTDMAVFFDWLTNTLQINKTEGYSMLALLAVLVLVLTIGVLKRKAAFLIGFIVRMTCGVAMILVVNSILSYYEISTLVGVNAISLLTSAILGIPGVCVLYAILFL